MDAVGLQVLVKEIEADCVVIRDAAAKAEARLEGGTDSGLEACAYQLTRLYNTLEQILERLCRDFENHFDKRGDYHERLVQRLALELPGIRPGFIPAASVHAVRELKGFRHVVRHAYDLDSKSRVCGNLQRWQRSLRPTFLPGPPTSRPRPRPNRGGPKPAHLAVMAL